jgi:hypothetical protein
MFDMDESSFIAGFFVGAGTVLVYVLIVVA